MRLLSMASVFCFENVAVLKSVNGLHYSKYVIKITLFTYACFASIANL